MKKTPQNDVLLAITQFLSSDFLQDEIQQLPSDIQNIFDLVLETEAGNSLQTRLKMLRIKELVTQSAKALAPFSEDKVQEFCKHHQQSQLN